MTSGAPGAPGRILAGRSGLLRPATFRVLLLLASLLSPAPARAAGTFVEKTVDVPRTTKIAVGVTFEKAVIQWVESQNDPKEKDVAEAAKSDPKGKTWVLLRFTYVNEGYVSHKVNLRVLLLDGSGGVLAEGGRRSALDAQEKKDTISFPIHVRTLDWPKAAKLKVMATLYD